MVENQILVALTLFLRIIYYSLKLKKRGPQGEKGPQKLKKVQNHAFSKCHLVEATSCFKNVIPGERQLLR